ncbi:MAG: flavin-containing monooxygenase, partial [Actinomycetota bacterium]
MDAEHVETVVIGGGQAGLAVGYHLARAGRSFVILDGSARIGDAWRSRWDSLRLFTPARYDGLPGMRFPARGDTFPTKDAMADFLAAYAKRFELPVRSGVKVDGLTKVDGCFVVTAGGRRFTADNVVVAMSNYQRPRVPAIAHDLDPGIVQLHSSEYKSPAQLRDGPVLVVGVGNSGAEIALDVAKTRPTWLAGKEHGHVPFRIERFAGRFVLVRIVRFVGHHVLTIRTPIGRKLRPKLHAGAAPLIRVKPKDLVAAGIKRVGRVTGSKNGHPLLEDGTDVDVANVIWCTGYHSGLSWIDLPVFDERGEPLHEAGIGHEKGLYFVGHHFLYSMTSDTIPGVGRDAARVARHI